MASSNAYPHPPPPTAQSIPPVAGAATVLWREKETQWFAVILAVAVITRIMTLLFTQLELGPDEAQYWFWSQSPAFGYFSKPPLIAWAIAASTAVFGGAEWAVRLPAPLFHAGASLFIFLLGRRLFNPRAGLWAGVLWLTMPGVILSSTLMTTDAPLLMMWSIALYLFFSAVKRKQNGASHRNRLLFLGGAVGFGFLAKYAMIYFVIGLALAAIFDIAARRLILSRDGAAAGAVAAAVFAPNVIWNARNDFQTLSHTAANANWASDLFHPIKLLEFLAGQFAVVGPILLAVMAVAVIHSFSTKGDRHRDTALLLGFILPVIIIVSVQALLSRAHANWASVAYPGAIILASGFAFAAPTAISAKNRIWRTAIRISAAIHVMAAIGFTVVVTTPQLPDAIGVGNAFKRLRGWKEQGAFVALAAYPYQAIMADDREIMGALLYYTRRNREAFSKPIIAWDSNNRIDHHYEAFNGFDPARDKEVLYATLYADALLIQNRFETITLTASHTVPLGNDSERTIYLFVVSGFRG